MSKDRLVDFLFFFAFFSFFLLPPTDPDLGWQLRCGELIWQQRNFCQQNQFTVLLPNYTWVNHHWGYQAILYPTHHFLGFWGLSFFNAAVVTLSFVFFYLSIKGLQLEKKIAVLSVVFLGWGVFSFGIRSQLLGFLFFNLMLWVFSQAKQNQNWWLLFPVITLAWVNTHGSFVLGLLLLITFVVIGSRSYLPIITMAISLVATFLNPSGLKIYQETLRHFLGPIDLSQLVAEWVPPHPGLWWLILLSGFSLFFYLLVTSPRKDLPLAFLLPVFLLLALSARRHVPFFLIISFYLLLKSTHFKNLIRPWRKQQGLRKNLAFLVGVALLFIATTFRLPQTIKANYSFESHCQNSNINYPCESVEFLKAQNVSGAVFNRYEWGGFLIWQLPEQKIFVDGRMPAWQHPSGKSPYTTYLEILQTQPGWEEILAKHNIEWILISPGTFLDLKLRNNPSSLGWQEVYRDKISVVYKRI